MKKILYIGNQLKQNNFTPTSVDILGTLLIKEGYLVHTASNKKNKGLRLLDMCFSIIKYRNKIDIVLIDTYSTTNFYYAVTVAWWCRFFKIPYIPILHGGNLPYRLQKSKKLSNRLFQQAKVNVTPSGYLLQKFKDAGYSNLVLIPNSLELKNYVFKQRKMAPAFLWVRSFSKIYNPLMALKVIDKIRKTYPEATLCMVGPDKDGSLEQCKKWAIANNIPVTFTGKLSKKDWLALSEDFTIFINTANFDNTPFTILEAMALGIPIVSTNVGGIPYLLEDRQTAILVNPEDAEAMTTAIKHLLQNEILAQTIAKTARKKVETFDWNEVKHLWKSVFE
ncbi:MAG: glycosyl transferase family 1 [Bacteroidetes bacterium HGW-Bacteroidetes-2]|jgi:glycosyltransferase involved in cell wall biosynthesis|nr:MAG: glycosyl transferase family 1 [Bacteroidetes bacterium HGW-Bacteroidetes-2]